MTNSDLVAGMGRRMLRQWTRIVIRHARLTVAIMLIFAVYCTVFSVNNLGISTDTEDMISDDLQWRQDFNEFREQFPQLYRLLVVVVDAQTEALAQAAVTELEAQIANTTNVVHSQYSVTVDAPLAGQELLLLSEDELYDLADDIAFAQPLIGRLRQNYSISEFFDMLSNAYSNDPAAIPPAFVKRLATSLQTSRIDENATLLDWSRLASDDDKPARRLILVKPVLDTEQSRPSMRALDALRELGAQTSQAYEGRVNVRLTGQVALEDEELVSASENAVTTAVLALISVLLILLLAFRSWRLLLISLLILIIGLIATAAFAAVAFGTLNVISIAFTVLYIGLAIDLVIHYLLRLRERLATHPDLHDALLDTSENIGGALFIATITTAAGFYAFAPTDFVGVSQLGLISGTGMFICLIVSITLLPALVWLAFPQGMQSGNMSSRWQAGAALSWLLKAPRFIIAFSLLAVCAAAFSLPNLKFENDPMLLRDPSTESVQTFNDLSADPNTALYSLSVVVDANTDADSLSDKLEQLDSVRHAITLASFEPADIDTQLSLVDEIALLMGDKFAEFPPLANIDADATTEAIKALRDTLASSENTADPENNADLNRSLAAITEQLDGLDAGARLEVLERIQRNLLGDLPAAMQLLASQLAPQRLDADQFPEEFRLRWISDSGQQLIQVIPANDVSEPQNAQHFVNQVTGVAANATGLPVVYERSGETIFSAFETAFITALLIISAFLYILLRDKKNLFVILIPLAVSAILLAGTMVLLDLPFNFANIIALPLLLGISVDAGIHLVHRSEQNMQGHSNLLTTSTARAILFSSVTTLASFGSLALSDHVGMASMGLLLTIGLVINMLVILLLLPALLSLRSQ